MRAHRQVTVAVPPARPLPLVKFRVLLSQTRCPSALRLKRPLSPTSRWPRLSLPAMQDLRPPLLLAEPTLPKNRRAEARRFLSELRPQRSSLEHCISVGPRCRDIRVSRQALRRKLRPHQSPFLRFRSRARRPTWRFQRPLHRHLRPRLRCRVRCPKRRPRRIPKMSRLVLPTTTLPRRVPRSRQALLYPLRASQRRKNPLCLRAARLRCCRQNRQRPTHLLPA